MEFSKRCGDKGTLLHCWWECDLVQPLLRTVWTFLKKLKIELLYDLGIPLLGTYLEKTIIQKDTYTPMFIAALFTIAKTWKQPKCLSTGEWIKKDVAYICNGTLISHKKEWNNAALWMDLEIISFLAVLGLSWGSQDLLCGMWDLVPWTRIEPGPPALEAQGVSHWATREVPTLSS